MGLVDYELREEPSCWDCGTPFSYGEGYGDPEYFCSQVCADSFSAGLGA